MTIRNDSEFARLSLMLLADHQACSNMHTYVWKVHPDVGSHGDFAHVHTSGTRFRMRSRSCDAASPFKSMQQHTIVLP